VLTCKKLRGYGKVCTVDGLIPTELRQGLVDAGSAVSFAVFLRTEDCKNA
jgi:hypothetical protein